MYAKDVLLPGKMLVLVYNHNFLKFCLSILPFPDVGLFLEVGWCTQIPTENNEQMPDHNDDMIQLKLRILPCHMLFCKNLRLHKTHRDHHFFKLLSWLHQDRIVHDWFSSCVDQYSMLLYQKIFFKCSTSLHNILSNIFLTVEPDTNVQKKLIFPLIIDGFK